MGDDIRQLPHTWAGQVTVNEDALGALAISTGKIAALAVTTAKIDNLAVTTGKIDNLAVTTGKIADAAITGAKASAALKTKSMQSVVPTIPTAAGTTEVCVLCPFTGTVSGIRFTNKAALATDNTNFLTFAIVNKGQAGAGTTALLAATDVNTTKTTGGSAIGAYTTRQLTNHGTPANLDVNQGDTLAVQFIGAGTLANTLTQGYIQINMTVDT